MSTPTIHKDFDGARRLYHPDKQYPAPTGEYAVRTKDGNEWRYHKAARLQISVGQPSHEGEKFKATVEWVKNRFNEKGNVIYIGINDSLQRWNHIFRGMSHDEALDAAIAEGDRWMAENSSIFNKLSNAQFTRWEAWRNHKDFNNAHTKAHALYGINQEFRDAIDRNIDDFWSRQKDKRNLNESDYASFKHYSKEYLIEETAVFSLMFKYHHAVDIYPGDTLLPCVIFQGRTDIEGLPDGLGTGAFTRIDHVKNKGWSGIDTDINSAPGSQETKGPIKSGNGPLGALGRLIHPENWHFANPNQGGRLAWEI